MTDLGVAGDRPPTHSKTVRLAAAALQSAQAGRWEAATRYVLRINDECGGQGLNTAICAWADAFVEHACDGMPDGPRFGRMGFINGDDGRLEHDDAERLPERIRWAGRLIQARAALDKEAFDALIDELPEDGFEIGRYVSAVLECVSQSMNGLPRGFASAAARKRWAGAS